MIISTQINAQNMASQLVSSVLPLQINSRFTLSINFGNSISDSNITTILYQCIITNSYIDNNYLIGGGGITLTGDLQKITGTATINCRLQSSSVRSGIPIILVGPVTITQNGLNVQIDGNCNGIIPSSNNSNLSILCIIKGKTTIGYNCNIKNIIFNIGEIKLAITTSN